MKSFRELRKALAIGAVVLLLLPGYCGCGVSVGGEDLPVPGKTTEVAPSDTQAAMFVTGAGSIGAKRLSSIKPVERPIAAAPAKAQVINVLDMQGTVTVVSGGIEMPAYADMRLSAGDKLSTGDNSSATLDLNNGGMVMVEANSALEITQSTAEYIEVSLLSGNIINNIEKGAGKYAVRANNVTMGVLGTVFRVKINGGIAKVDLYEGSVSVTLALDGGESYTYDLGEGMSFEGTDETINNSIENGSLETEELDLDELPDDALDWIAQALEDRVNTDDDPEALNALLNALHGEIERRRQDDLPPAPPAPPETPPEIPPVDYSPAPPPAPTPAPQPNLSWADATMDGIATGDTIVDYSLTLWWSVQNSTTPWYYGYHWTYDGWNQGKTTENENSFYTVNGIEYYVSSNGTESDDRLTIQAQQLNAPFASPAPVTLNVILVPADFDNVNVAQVFDHNTVVVNDMTPTIAVAPSATDGEMATVTVTPPTDAIDEYKTEATEGSASISIPVDESSYDITGEIVPVIAEATVYPEGQEVGMAIDSAAGDTITVDVYLPTEVVPEDPEAPGEE